jgi:hypothetical protein
MQTAAVVFAAIAALIHLYIFVLESLRWTAPATRKIFGTTASSAETTRPLAFNQGFYKPVPGRGQHRRGDPAPGGSGRGRPGADLRRSRVDAGGGARADRQRPDQGQGRCRAGALLPLLAVVFLLLSVS